MTLPHMHFTITASPRIHKDMTVSKKICTTRLDGRAKGTRKKGNGSGPGHFHRYLVDFIARACLLAVIDAEVILALVLDR